MTSTLSGYCKAVFLFLWSLHVIRSGGTILREQTHSPPLVFLAQVDQDPPQALQQHTNVHVNKVSKLDRHSTNNISLFPRQKWESIHGKRWTIRSFRASSECNHDMQLEKPEMTQSTTGRLWPQHSPFYNQHDHQELKLPIAASSAVIAWAFSSSRMSFDSLPWFLRPVPFTKAFFWGTTEVGQERNMREEFIPYFYVCPILPPCLWCSESEARNLPSSVWLKMPCFVCFI